MGNHCNRCYHRCHHRPQLQPSHHPPQPLSQPSSPPVVTPSPARLPARPLPAPAPGHPRCRSSTDRLAGGPAGPGEYVRGACPLRVRGDEHAEGRAAWQHGRLVYRSCLRQADADLEAAPAAGPSPARPRKPRRGTRGLDQHGQARPSPPTTACPRPLGCTTHTHSLDTRGVARTHAMPRPKQQNEHPDKKSHNVLLGGVVPVMTPFNSFG